MLSEFPIDFCSSRYDRNFNVNVCKREIFQKGWNSLSELRAPTRCEIQITRRTRRSAYACRWWWWLQLTAVVVPPITVAVFVFGGYWHEFSQTLNRPQQLRPSTTTTQRQSRFSFFPPFSLINRFKYIPLQQTDMWCGVGQSSPGTMFLADLA